MTPNEQELIRWYSNHPDKLLAAHRAVLGSTGLSPDAIEHIAKSGDAGLAHHPELRTIASLPRNQHIEAVKQLRAGELSGAKRPGAAHKNESDNERTDRYISSRPKLGRHERRTRLVR
jgi:hypothetical protein